MGLLPIQNCSYDDLPRILKEKHSIETVNTVKMGLDEKKRPIFIIRPHLTDNIMDGKVYEYYQSHGAWHHRIKE
jgi:hypothetical protein